MSKFDRVPSRKKVYKVMHFEPLDYQKDFILLPIGYSYNSEWRGAKKGDYIRFHDGGTYRIFSVRIVKAHGGLADLLSRIRYGITFAGCVQSWKMNARLEGHSGSAVSNSECLWIVYEKESEEGYKGRKVQD